MIKEYNKNIKKCHNCGKIWTFNNEDVKEVTRYGGFQGDYKENFIICPHCKNYLEIYNNKGVWR